MEAFTSRKVAFRPSSFPPPPPFLPFLAAEKGGGNSLSLRATPLTRNCANSQRGNLTLMRVRTATRRKRCGGWKVDA